MLAGNFKYYEITPISIILSTNLGQVTTHENTLTETKNLIYYSLFFTPKKPLTQMIGTYKTLYEIPKSFGINLRNELMKFYNSTYSAHIMKLSILGKGKSNFHEFSLKFL